MPDYVMFNGKKLRKGYTTGVCAAAAARAATLMLVTGQPLASITITIPAGMTLQLPVSDTGLTETEARCAVLKDGGDDPDVTTGLKIFATVRFIPEAEIRITAGEGIGTVTLPGLKVAVGEPAINPVPRQMIIKEVQTVLPAGKGLEVTLSVPGGEEAAARTFNPRLGIKGGISILGTTGIVNPMSEDAWKEALAAELSVQTARGANALVYTWGNYGYAFAEKKLRIKPENIIKISNFLGFMLGEAAGRGVTKILLAGHLGKLVKVAAGIFHTHNRVADARRETLTAYAALEGAPRAVLQQLFACTTTEAAIEILNSHGLAPVYGRLAVAVSQRCREYVADKIRFATILFHEEHTFLAMDPAAEELITALGGNPERGWKEPGGRPLSI